MMSPSIDIQVKGLWKVQALISFLKLIALAGYLLPERPRIRLYCALMSFGVLQANRIVTVQVAP